MPASEYTQLAARITRLRACRIARQVSMYWISPPQEAAHARTENASADSGTASPYTTPPKPTGMGLTVAEGVRERVRLPTRAAFPPQRHPLRRSRFRLIETIYSAKRKSSRVSRCALQHLNRRKQHADTALAAGTVQLFS